MLVTLFRTRPARTLAAGYAPDLDLEALARGNSGFIDARSYTANNGEQLTVVWSRDHESLPEWRELVCRVEANASAAQPHGRYYTMEVASVIRTQSEHLHADPAQHAPFAESREASTSPFHDFPLFVRASTDHLSGDDLHRRPANALFSLLEHACHLRDYEAEGVLGRIYRILLEDVPSLSDFPGEQLALVRNYQQQDLAAALDDFSRLRSQTFALLHRLSPAQWERTAQIGSMGLVSIRRLIEVVAAHDQTHRIEIEQLLTELKSR
jgi:hypothetical protein